MTDYKIPRNDSGCVDWDVVISDLARETGSGKGPKRAVSILRAMVKNERLSCAMVCEVLAVGFDGSSAVAAMTCANKIRAREIE